MSATTLNRCALCGRTEQHIHYVWRGITERWEWYLPTEICKALAAR